MDAFQDFINDLYAEDRDLAENVLTFLAWVADSGGSQKTIEEFLILLRNASDTYDINNPDLPF